MCLILQVIFRSGIWSRDRSYEVQHNELRCLEGELPSVLLNSKAHSTNLQYGGAFDRWRCWATKFNLQAIPADPYYISLYLVSLSHSCKSPAPILKATCSISWAHKLAGLEDPCLGHLVKSTIEGLKRNLSVPLNKKEPITVEILEAMYDNICSDLSINNLFHIRTVVMCLLAFAGFLRFSELVNVKRCHLQFHSSHLDVFLPKSKTDIYRDGKHVIIARTGSKICPVGLLDKYIQLVESNGCVGPESYIFRSLSKLKQGFKLRDANQPMSYTRVREIILDALKPLVGDVSKFCVHSLRSGGASAAANAGIQDRLFKRHGRWKSDSAKDGYVKDSLDVRLSVSKSLGL